MKIALCSATFPFRDRMAFPVTRTGIGARTNRPVPRRDGDAETGPVTRLPRHQTTRGALKRRRARDR